jgi:hypothetical protein
VVHQHRAVHHGGYVTHPWVFHSIPVNASDRPRLMRSTGVGVRR